YISAHPEFLDRAMETLLVEEVNERAVQMFGAREATELLGPMTWLWRSSRGTIRRALESRYRGEASFSEDTSVAALDGRTLNVHFSAARLDSTTDFRIGIAGMVDISERIQAQEKLQRVQAEFAHALRVSMLGELTASIAHEINQPLAAIATNGEASLRW